MQNYMIDQTNRAESKLVILQNILNELKDTPQNNMSGDIVLTHINNELAKLIKFLSP